MKSLFESVRPLELKESSTTLPEMVLYRDFVRHKLHSTFVETGRVDEFFVMFYQAKRV